VRAAMFVGRKTRKTQMSEGQALCGVSFNREGKDRIANFSFVWMRTENERVLEKWHLRLGNYGATSPHSASRPLIIQKRLQLVDGIAELVCAAEFAKDFRHGNKG
jgi:hypothetical protein